MLLVSAEVASSPPQGRPYFPAIDGLRSVAVLMVLTFHFDLFSSAGGGFAGVDVFFVISGFLITSIIDRQIMAGRFRLSTFYLDRIRRLAPSLFLTLSGTFIAGLVWLYPMDLVELSKQAVAAQIYVANIYFWRTMNYFGITSSSAFLLHTWSLAVEEQFYLIYPLFLVVAYQFASKYVWQIIFGILVLSFGLNVFLVHIKPEATFYLLPTRAWELLVGALIVRLRARNDFPVFANEFFGVLGIILIGCSLFGYHREFAFPGFFAAVPTIGAALVIVATTGKQTLFSTLLGNPVSTYIGRISYPLYLVHWPLYVFAIHLSADSLAPIARWSLLVLAIVIASAMFHLFEEPVRQKRIFQSAWSLRTGYVAAVAVALLTCAITYRTGGIPQRYDPEVARLANFTNDRTPDLPCRFLNGTIKFNDFCRIGVKAEQPAWLIYGDSHAWAAYAAFDKWLKDTGQSGVFMFREACPPLTGIHLFHDSACFEFNDEMFRFLGKAPYIENVLLVSTWLQAREGLLGTSESVASSSEESMSLFKQRFLATAAELKKLGKHVVVWEPVPGAKRNTPEALATAYPNKDYRSLEFTKQQYLARFDFFFEALAQSKGSIDATVSPSQALCGTGYCSATINENPAYFDNGHIAASTYEFWASILASSIPNMDSTKE
jgi:peptidoglycan/LPS O-acetylase OafA/YrhL